MRQRFQRTGGKLFLIVGLVLAMLAGLEFAVTSASGAATTTVGSITFVQEGAGLDIFGSAAGMPFGHFAGIYIVNTGTGHLLTYCIDISGADPAAGQTWREGTWAEAEAINTRLSGNLPFIRHILRTHVATASTTNEEAAAVQAAIWHFSDAFDLDPNQPASLRAATAAIIADAQSHPEATEPPAPSLTLTPASATGVAGEAVGPFTLNTTADQPVTLSVEPANGATITNCTTHQTITTAVNGDKICLVRSNAGGPVTLKAAGQATLLVGRVFIGVNSSGQTNPNTQVLILASPKELTAQASATGTWTAAATTTTTAPTTTSTSVAPTTTSTSVAPTTTSTTAASTTTTTAAPPSVLGTQQSPPEATAPAATSAPATAPSTTSTLPMTGTQPIPTAILALTFLLLGALLLGLARPIPAFAGVATTLTERPRSTWNSTIRPNLPWWLRRSHARTPLQ